MPIIVEGDTFTQVIQFEIAPGRAERLISAVTAEVERWVSRLPGFVSSSFHASEDGRHMLNYAQWRSRADFDGFMCHPEGERLSKAIRAVGPIRGPDAIAYRVVRTIDAAAPASRTEAHHATQ